MARTQLLLASTLYGIATLAAAIDAGSVPPADRRILVVSNNAAVPETHDAPDRAPGFEPLRTRFDRVVSWNDAIRPMHPGGWAPRTDEVPMWDRYFRQLWQLDDDDLDLVVESIQVAPALSFAQVFTGAPITVYADGLMSYGPTRNKLGLLVDTRIDALLHLDLVPGLEPLLLSEFGVPSRVVPSSEFTKVLAEVAEATRGHGIGPDPVDELPRDAALLLGQYLSALGILSVEEEEKLHLSLVRGAVALGHRRLVFKPHPTAPSHWLEPLREEARKLGAELTVLDSPVLAEVVYQRARPALVAGCFSTALLTASALYGIPVARSGTKLLLDRLSPYQNSNRVPVTLVHALLPEVSDPDAVRGWTPPSPRQVATELTPLLHAVGYCMQAEAYPHLRAEAVAWLEDHLGSGVAPYFKRRRLTSLGLPGALPARRSLVPRVRAVRQVARGARALKKAALG
ncbi:alpha-2,8-polysialyltransferase family protein [Streptomyces sp. NPDC087270]|uniref:alpha-2,8-polysialyltransferase family protein n=1 Tax=Streptomyces sp. NPDC087270 TaxID=3365774 RepID=UPI0037FFE28F